MKSRTIIVVILMLAASAAGQSVPPPDPAKVERAFLDVPVWYLTYRVSVVCRDGASGQDGSYWRVKSDRVTTGSARLGIRSGGPSLSMTRGIPLQGQAFFDLIDHFANWIGGIMPDENKSDAENDAALLQVFEANQKAFERFSYELESEHPGTVAESRGPAGMEHERVTQSGAAPVNCMADFHFEINGAKKTYLFKFATGFTDTVQSMTAVTGKSVVRIGAPDEFHLPIVTSLGAGTPHITSGGPADAIIEGKLPATFGSLAGSVSYPVRIGSRGDKATLTIQYALSPEPPEEVELVIEPPSGYENWRPLGGEDEVTARDFVPVKVHYQKRGGGKPKTKATRFVYKLVDTSHEKGVCMNWPLRPAADSPRDLQFEPGRNAALAILDNERQSAAEDGDDLTDGAVVVSCFDYGASSTFTAEAQLAGGRTILGTVKGTQREYLNLPDRKTGSWIASKFFKDRGLGDLPDGDDAENDPVGDGYKGDGLTLYEEYRGFKHGDEWITGDPKAKDLFVINQLRGMKQVQAGIDLLEAATRLNVHAQLREYQVDEKMVINFNHTDAPHIDDQHALRIMAGQRAGGGTVAYAGNGGGVPGTPGTIKNVHVPANWSGFASGNPAADEYFAATLAHEMLHACNVYHHGEADRTVRWEFRSSPSPHIVEIEGSGETAITLKREDGTIIPAIGFFPSAMTDPLGGDMEVVLGQPHGQHSGGDGCLMRYDVATAYISSADPTVRYVTGGEFTGLGLCVTAAGTGVNSPGHQPQSRFDSAATPANGGPKVRDDRGKCTFQLRVNDHGSAPQR